MNSNIKGHSMSEQKDENKYIFTIAEIKAKTVP